VPGAFTIELPLPRRTLSPNARPHWRTKARAVKAYRTLAWALAVEALGGKRPGWPRARARARFFFVDSRKRDGDNFLASLKSAFDGIADAGAVANDSGLAHEPPEFHVDRERPRVEITLEEVP
jgi:crossover junction endodeoxyribonuclease RusA